VGKVEKNGGWLEIKFHLIYEQSEYALDYYLRWAGKNYPISKITMFIKNSFESISC